MEALATEQAKRETDESKNVIRRPIIRRETALLVMIFAALVGAAAGLRLGFSDASEKVGLMSAGNFGEVFLRNALESGAFVCGALLLGFFAFGDLLVWSLPFLCAERWALRFALGEPLKMLPCALICCGAAAAAAARSARLSGLLLKLTRGGTVCMETSPARTLLTSLFGCLAAALAGSLSAGISAING